jgi:hypothetical protein
MRLRACSPEGDLEQPMQCVEFAYERLADVGIDNDEMAVWFEIAAEGRPTVKRIKIYTGFVRLFLTKFESVLMRHSNSIISFY